MSLKKKINGHKSWVVMN